MDVINLLVAVPQNRLEDYSNNLAEQGSYEVELVDNIQAAHQTLFDSDRRIDVFVIDNRLGNVHHLIHELRQGYPRLLIILVDEEADFGMPGQADGFTNIPFEDDDLVNKINKLIFERRQETLRSDSLPAVREISRSLRMATGLVGKQQAAVEAVMNMEFDYVAYYHIEDKSLKRTAQIGPRPIMAVAPEEATPDDLMTWVAQHNQSRIASYGEELNHPLVAKGRLGAVACIPVTFDDRLFGVLVACRERPNSISQENVMMLELASAQLAVVTSKEIK